ncbi:MAG: GGDEF domain-containing protein, partial [Pseudomonadales bacterium]|nr:GGDEF domain-containing protein [Pseudomonadales bacterium]
MTATQSPNPLPTGSDISLPWHLRLPKALEKDFRLYFRASVAKVAPGAFLLIGVLLACAMLVESLVGAEIIASSWRPRLFTLMLTGGCLLLARNLRWREWLHPATLTLGITIALTGNYLGYTVDHPLAYTFYLHTPMAVIMICTLIRVPFYQALGCSLAMLIVLGATMLLDPTPVAFEPLTLMLVTLAFSSMSLFGQYVYERLLRQHFLSEHVLFQHRDELHSANLILENQATVDGMTGCINRRGMESRLNHLYHLLKQQSPEAPERVTLMLFDIDFF